MTDNDRISPKVYVFLPFMKSKSKLDLDLNAGRQLNVHQRIHSLLGGLDDVDESLVRAHLKLLTAILVLVHSAEDRDDLSLRGPRYRTRNGSAVSLCNVYDLLSGSVDEGVVVARQSDSDLFLYSHLFCLLFEFCVPNACVLYNK